MTEKYPSPPHLVIHVTLTVLELAVSSRLALTH